MSEGSFDAVLGLLAIFLLRDLLGALIVFAGALFLLRVFLAPEPSR